MAIITLKLSPRQQETIKHLNDAGIKTPKAIVGYCKSRLLRPQKNNHLKHPEQRVPGRKHSLRYYQEILEFYTTKPI